MESVAQALTWAINDPSGQPFDNLSMCRPSGNNTVLCKRPRSAKETQQAAKVFDSSAIPPIEINKYLMRLSATFRCSDATFIAALIIVDRLLEFDGGRLPLTLRNVHRVFLASLVVAVKYHEDLVYSNSHYAKAGGVHLREVNRLERVLLAAIDFDLRVEPEQYRLYEAALLSSSTSPNCPAPMLPTQIETAPNTNCSTSAVAAAGHQAGASVAVDSAAGVTVDVSASDPPKAAAARPLSARSKTGGGRGGKGGAANNGAGVKALAPVPPPRRAAPAPIAWGNGAVWGDDAAWGCDAAGGVGASGCSGYPVAVCAGVWPYVSQTAGMDAAWQQVSAANDGTLIYPGVTVSNGLGELM